MLTSVKNIFAEINYAFVNLYVLVACIEVDVCIHARVPVSLLGFGLEGRGSQNT